MADPAIGQQCLADLIAIHLAATAIAETGPHRLPVAIIQLAGQRTAGGAGSAGGMPMPVTGQPNSNHL